MGLPPVAQPLLPAPSLEAAVRFFFAYYSFRAVVVAAYATAFSLSRSADNLSARLRLFHNHSRRRESEVSSHVSIPIPCLADSLPAITPPHDLFTAAVRVDCRGSHRRHSPRRAGYAFHALDNFSLLPIAFLANRPVSSDASPIFIRLMDLRSALRAIRRHLRRSGHAPPELGSHFFAGNRRLFIVLWTRRIIGNFCGDLCYAVL